MKIIVDNAIPFLSGVFEPFFDVVYKPGKEINADDVKDADALVIRTRTKCNANLLKDSKVKLIATATIGEDHIDKNFCAQNGIKVKNAAGCNAGGVVQYVFTALYELAEKKGFNLPKSADNKSITLGVVGVGNVGKKVAEMGEKLGFRVLKNDPLISDSTNLEKLLSESDIVTMHTSLNPTSVKLANKDFFKKMKDGAVFINASRGEVVDDEALIEYKDKFKAIVLDVWNNEPLLNETLLNLVDISTPHIAGYSLEGKMNGTSMSVRNVAEFFNIIELAHFMVDETKLNVESMKEINLNYLFGQPNVINSIRESFNKSYDIMLDSKKLKEHYTDFEKLRNNYNYRREFKLIS